MDGIAILSNKVGIRGLGITASMDINGPKPPWISSRNLISDTVTIRTILTATARELFEDDVPVGRLRRHILLSFQRKGTTVEAFMEEIRQSLAENKENVYLRGFGTFIVKRRAQKTARNISKNTTIIIDAHNFPAFKPSKSFIEKMK